MKNKKVLLPVLAVLLLALVAYLWPLSGEKVMAEHNVPVDLINQAIVRPIDLNKPVEIVDVQPGNRQLKEFLNSLKLRRMFPKNREDGMYFYHDSYTFYYDDGVQRYPVDVYMEEYLVVGDTWYKIIG